MTGFTSFNAAIAGKWLQLLKEISPGTDRIALMYNPTTAPFAIFLPVMQAEAPRMGVTLSEIRIGDEAAIENALAQFANTPRGACRHAGRFHHTASGHDLQDYHPASLADDVPASRVCRGWRVDVVRIEFR